MNLFIIFRRGGFNTIEISHTGVCWSWISSNVCRKWGEKNVPRVPLLDIFAISMKPYQYERERRIKPWVMALAPRTYITRPVASYAVLKDQTFLHGGRNCCLELFCLTKLHKVWPYRLPSLYIIDCMRVSYYSVYVNMNIIYFALF